jgi:hypothetical protein
MKQITIDDREFTFLGIEPHTRQDGRETKLYRWQVQCTHPDCTASWEFRAPAINVEGQLEPPDAPSRHTSYRFKRKFCLKHTKKRKRDLSTYAKQSKVSATDVQVMKEIAKTHKGRRIDLYLRLSVLFGVTPSTTREILAGRRRATAT